MGDPFLSFWGGIILERILAVVISLDWNMMKMRVPSGSISVRR
jgi:hypothetical protein